MKRIPCLRNFRYFEIDTSSVDDGFKGFELTANACPFYFKSEVLGKNDIMWDGKLISQLMNSDNVPPFDSGIVCSLSSNLTTEQDTINKLNCFFAPYQLMEKTIKERDIRKKTSKDVHDNSIAVGIGMVLSIIVTKGSSETGIRKPYMIFVNRGDNLGVRNGELDVPVVEGLNCSDFSVNSQRCTAELEAIAERALREERGLNCEMLKSLGLLHMPCRYYLGYDKTYMQWNFFGTVVVDCTVEEIVREGFYYTKDKFESCKIIAIPAEPQVLYYHLSEKTLQRKTEADGTAKRFWNTAWASVSFALRDFADKYKAEEMQSSCEEKWFLMQKSLPTIIEPTRNLVNLVARWFEKHRKLIEISSGLSSVIAILLFVLSAINQESYADKFNDFSSLLMAVLTCLLAVSLARRERISTDGIIEIELNTDNRGYLIPEIQVFREVVLLDGNIGEKNKNVFIEYQHTSDNESLVKVERKCKMFYDASTPGKIWEMIEPNADSEEHIKWVIKTNERSQKNLRILFPCICRERTIVFQDSESKLSHYADYEIPYSELASASNINALIKQKILKKLEKLVECSLLPDIEIQYKFLMKYNGQFVIAGYIHLNQEPARGEIYPLSYDLTNTSFCLKMKDDVTRVSCEYAVAEHIGYKMFNR